MIQIRFSTIEQLWLALLWPKLYSTITNQKISSENLNKLELPSVFNRGLRAQFCHISHAGMEVALKARDLNLCCTSLDLNLRRLDYKDDT